MRKIEAVCNYLGEPYTITTIDGEEVIYRDLGNGYDFEISGVRSTEGRYTLYVWRASPREIIGIYQDIKGQANLKDILGHYAVKYQNLMDQIRVERED